MSVIAEFKHYSMGFKDDDGKVFNLLDDLSFQVEAGKALGIVGESGCGKSMTSLSLMRLLPDAAVVQSGEILLEGKDLLKMSDEEMQKIRGDRIAMIFQEPMTALNPVLTIGDQIGEVLHLHHPEMKQADINLRVAEALKNVGISSPETRMKQYPHEFSGGMRQRAMIAMALSCNPKLLIADEPTTALDVTIQAQIMELLGELKEQISTAIILITHDLGVVAGSADRVAVMYAGKVVETGSCDDIFYRGSHPYTKALLKSLPSPETTKEEKLMSIPGTPPDLLAPPKGCGFAARCRHCMTICQEEQPPEFSLGEGHTACCWLLHPDCPSAVERGDENAE